MNEELQSLIDRAMAAGRSPEQIVSALKQNGLDDNGLMSVDSYLKKKSPSDLEDSSSQSDLRPSVSESLSSERVQLGFDESAIQQKKKAIADAAAAQVYTAVAKTGGDLNKIQDKQAFANAYTTYRSMSDDPRAAALPQNPVAQDGQIDFAVVPTLKKGATEYINDLIKQEEARKAKLGEKITVPVLSEVASGTEALIGGVLKFNEMITGKDSELADFFLDDAATRSRDALIDYGLTEEDISKGLIGNMSEGNIGTGLAIFGSTLVQQLPQLAAVALTGGAGLPLLAASAAGSGYASFEDRSDLSEGEKMLYGIGVGAAEFLAEKLFVGDINLIRKALGKEGVEGLTKKELGDMMFGALPKGVRGVMEEGTEELLTSVAQQTLGKIIAGEEFDPIEIAESAIYGGTLGGSIYLLSRGAGAIVDPENEANIRGLKSQLAKTKEAQQRPDLTDAEKGALKRKAEEVQSAISALKVKDDELVARMSEEDRTVLRDVQTQIKANISDIRSAKTEEGQQQLKQELKRNLEQLTELRNKYGSQEEVGVPSPVVEGQAPIEAQPIEGTSAETPQAGGVLQVPIEEGTQEVAPTAEAEQITEVVEAPTAEAAPEIQVTEEAPQVAAETVGVDVRDQIKDLSQDAIREAYDEIPMNLLPVSDTGTSAVDDIRDAYRRAKASGKHPEFVAKVEGLVNPVEVSTDGEAFITASKAAKPYSDLYSFLKSGLIGRESSRDTTGNLAKKRRLQSIAEQFVSRDSITLLRAKNILSVLGNFVPETQRELDLFNKAYAQAENMFEQLKRADKTEGVFKTKKEIIATISRQRKLSTRQKETLIAIVNSIQSDRLFNMNFQGDESFYSFSTNLLKANEPGSFIHEIGHWGYYNLLTSQERIEYMNYVSQKFMGKDVEGLVFPAQIPYKGRIATSGTNAQDNYQEYFAVQFEQWFANKVGVPEFLERIFDQLGAIVENLITLFKEKGYNPDMVKYFDKIIDTTKFSMSDAQAAELNKQLEDNQDLGTQTIGETDVLDYNVVDQEKTEALDIRQETFKDKAKKAWRSMWWSDEQRQIRTFKESLNSMLSREAMKIKEFAVGLNKLLKNADQATVDLVSKVMDGSITPEEQAELLTKKDGNLIFSLSNAMREYIDSLSESIVFDPAFSKLSEDLQNTIIDNLGTYLRGTYRFWKDKRFFPGEETIKAAIEEVYNTMYNEKFAELEQLFDVDGVESNIAKLEDQYEQLREAIIEEERKLPAGEKTVEIKAMIANLDALGKELNAARKLLVEQKRVMKELLKTDEMTPENIKAFAALKNSYIDSQIEFLAPAIKEEAKDFVKAYLEEAKKIRERDDFKGLGMISPSSIRIPSKQFSQRKNLPETVKALLGEEKDPIIKFIDTTLSLSNIKYKGDMIYKIASQFKGTDFVKTEATRAEVASGEYRIITDKFSPLNGKYVHKDVFEAITDPQLYDSETAWFQTYLNILLLGRKSKVIYNLPTWRKNLTGGWYTMMANGVINPSFFSDMRRRTQLLLDKRTDPETEQLLDIMAQYGLIGQGVDANLIGAVNVMYTRPSTGSDMEYLNAFQRLGERVKGLDAEIGNKYASVDDYTKLVVFRSEIESFAVKLFGKSYDSLSDSEKEKVHEQAAERVKQSTPTFSRLPPFYYKLARMPLGDFLSFEFEAFRSFTANFANGYEDIQTAINDKTLSPEQKAAYMKAGVARLMGTAAVFGARAAVPAILAGLALGDDDDLEEDVKSLRPNWMEGHSIVPTAISKDGMATVYDYSMEDPYGTIFDVVTDPLSFPSHAVSMLNPNMAITFLFNLYDSKDVYGKNIVNSYDSDFTKAYKYSGYTLKSLVVPPFISSAVRDEFRRAEVEADKYSPSDAVGRVASRAIIRDYKYDVGSQLYYFGQEFATKREQYTDLTGTARGNRLSELEDVRKMYKGLINIAIKKGNTKLILDANKNIKRQFKPAEEAYILYGYEIPEKQ